MRYLQVLTGHKENAEFALAMCPKEPYVLSGGRKAVFLELVVSTLFDGCATFYFQNCNGVMKFSFESRLNKDIT